MVKIISDKEEEIGKTIVNAAFTVHKALGPGLLEKVYYVDMLILNNSLRLSVLAARTFYL